MVRNFPVEKYSLLPPMSPVFDEINVRAKHTMFWVTFF